jgi:hypothetical protein
MNCDCLQATVERPLSIPILGEVWERARAMELESGGARVRLWDQAQGIGEKMGYIRSRRVRICFGGRAVRMWSSANWKTRGARMASPVRCVSVKWLVLGLRS